LLRVVKRGGNERPADAHPVVERKFLKLFCGKLASLVLRQKPMALSSPGKSHRRYQAYSRSIKGVEFISTNEKGMPGNAGGFARELNAGDFARGA